MNRAIYKYIKGDYRHKICLLITFVTVMCAFLFPNALPRLIESIRDLILSFLYYFIEILDLGVNPIYPTVRNIQEWNIFREVWQPLRVFPYTWEEFILSLTKFADLIFSFENFVSYISFLFRSLSLISDLLILFITVLPIVMIEINNYKKVHCTERGLKSKELLSFERFMDKYIYPAITWCKGFKAFCLEHGYFRLWCILWLLYFNVYSIIISALAFYLYFVSTFDLFNLYIQLLKLQLDLTPVIRFVPGIIWATVFAVVYNRICRSMAYNQLYHAEQCNEAVLRERGVSTVVFGEMGKGKTQLITSMALTAQSKIFKDMLKVMQKYDHFFPNYPWQIFRDELRARIEMREIVDLTSCRRTVAKMHERFNYINTKYTFETYQELIKNHQNFKDHTILGYDFEKYRVTYNDGTKLIHLFEALEEYACAYFVFTVQTSILFTNYSIRTDSIIDDIGNMPLRDNDFFNRDPELQEVYSHYSHIVDMDMIRLGKMIIENNEYGRTLHPGIYVISEIDKERKNMLELKETKYSVDETNQKNDLFNPGIMMSRHANVVDYIPVIYFIFDLQRPEGWGAGGRELGEVIYISDKGELAPTLPFFSPYWLFQGVFENIKEKWLSFYTEYIYNRSDETLFVYLAKNIISAISNHYDKINGLFGMQTFSLEIQSGRLDGNVKKDKWRMLTKKDRSNRYRTDCLKSVYESYIPNKMHIDDYKMYAGILATSEELALQNSYFQNDIKKMKGGNS